MISLNESLSPKVWSKYIFRPRSALGFAQRIGSEKGCKSEVTQRITSWTSVLFWQSFPAVLHLAGHTAVHRQKALF